MSCFRWVEERVDLDCFLSSCRSGGDTDWLEVRKEKGTVADAAVPFPFLSVLGFDPFNVLSA